jgi:hypothetical protein
MTTTELALNTTNFQYPEVRQLALLHKASQLLAEPTNELVPGPMRGKPGAILTSILMARDLGLIGTSSDPLRGLAVALTQIYVIDGKATLSAQLMRGLILRDGHKIEYLEMDNEVCTLKGTRRDGAELTVSWSIQDAERAELSTVQGSGKLKLNWQHFPRSMLLARATTELARALFPDVVMWAGYTPDELGGDVHPSDVLDAESVEALGKAPE